MSQKGFSEKICIHYNIIKSVYYILNKNDDTFDCWQLYVDELYFYYTGFLFYN